jgi:uncharacterized damage-inducible protein DinB
MLETLVQIFERDLDKLKSEIEVFPEDKLWITSGDIKNSAGNLAIHIAGGLEHFIGFGLGHSEYLRDRDFEFEAKGLTKKEIFERISSAKDFTSRTLKNLDPKKLPNPYPKEVADRGWTIEFFLIHLVSHVNYHLGQINYLRRLVS